MIGNVTVEQLREKISAFTAAGSFSLFMAISFPAADITADGLPSSKLLSLVFFLLFLSVSLHLVIGSQVIYFLLSYIISAEIHTSFISLLYSFISITTLFCT